MSAFISAAVITVGAGIYNQRKQAKAAKKAQQKAVEQAELDAQNARKAEVFAETEGEGIGQIGEVSLELDEEVDEEEEALRQGSLSV